MFIQAVSTVNLTLKLLNVLTGTDSDSAETTFLPQTPLYGAT